MLNGRWFESDEIFHRIPAPIKSNEVDQLVLEMASPPATAVTVSEDQDLEKRPINKMKEIRFREVLLSQTDHELSLIQV
jgi:hypothetical protein